MYWAIICFTNQLVTFLHCYYVLDIFNVVDFFSDFCYIVKY